MTVRAPKPLLQRIDSYIDRRDVPISRNNRLLEAAIEKLDRQRGQRGGRDGA